MSRISSHLTFLNAKLKTPALVVLFFISLASPSYGSQATVTFEWCGARINGTIDNSTVMQIKKWEAKGCPWLMVYMNSMGGDAYAAVELGKELRRRQAMVIVEEKEYCVSACVLVLLGGVEKVASGYVGLHRPYAIAPALTVEEAQKTYSDIYQYLKSYFVEMNAPLRLLDSMYAVSSTDIRWIDPGNEELLTELGLLGRDAVYEDLKLSEYAKELGIPKEELIKRIQTAKALCDRLSSVDSIRCRMRVIDGIQLEKP